VLQLVKREELEQMIKEKILLIGDSGTGKTYTSVKVAEFVAEAGRKVVYIDPDVGAERELELLSDEALENIELKVTTDWLSTKHAIMSEDACFLKVLDGLGSVFEQAKVYLVDRFLAQRYYVVGDKELEIKHKETFTLPWASYPKVYDDVRMAVHNLCIKQKPHVICTMHAWGESEARQRLTEDIYRKFDTVIDLRRTPVSQPLPGIVYDAVLRKHRGRPITAKAVLEKHVEQLRKLFGRRMKGGVSD